MQALAGHRLERPVDPRTLALLQQAAGNRAVSGLLTDRVGVPVAQRQPEPRVIPPDTHRWVEEEPFRDDAAMFRTTTIEVTAWAEVGPGSPRISYRREVELQTIDGISFYLDIRGNVALPPGAALPTSPEKALQARGRLVRSQRTVHVEGGDVIEVREYSPHQVGGQSFDFVANAVMPDYARLSLTPKQQEKAILAYLAKLPRRPRAPTPVDTTGAAIGAAADLGTDFIPIIGELKDLYRALTGTDPYTGRKLAFWERALAFLGALPLVGKLSKGVRAGVLFLGKGLSWLRGKGAVLAEWFARRLERWRSSRKIKRLADEQERARQLAAGNRARKMFLAEREALVAVVDKNGAIIAKHNAATMSHQALIDQKLNGVLPEGARAVTILKEDGVIHAIDSVGVHGRALPSPQWVIDAVRNLVE